MIRDLNNEQIKAVLYEAQQKIELLTGRAVRLNAEYNLPLDRIRPDMILDAVAEITGVDAEAIRSGRRTEELVDIRNCIMYFLRRKTSWDDARISEAVNRERTAAIHAEQSIANLIKAGNDRFMERFGKVYAAVRKIAEQEAAHT